MMLLKFFSYSYIGTAKRKFQGRDRSLGIFFLIGIMGSLTSTRALDSEEYFPLDRGTQHIIIENNSSTIIATFASGQQINGTSTKYIEYRFPTTSIRKSIRLFFTNDSQGLMLHGKSLNTPDGRNTTFAPPIRMFRKDFNIGDQIVSNGAVSLTELERQDKKFIYNYTASVHVEKEETLDVPMNQFSVVKVVVNTRTFGDSFDETEVDTFWFSRQIGAVKKIVTIDGNIHSFELSAISPLSLGNIMVNLAPSDVREEGAQWKLVARPNKFISHYGNFKHCNFI